MSDFKPIVHQDAMWKAIPHVRVKVLGLYLEKATAWVLDEAENVYHTVRVVDLYAVPRTVEDVAMDAATACSHNATLGKDAVVILAAHREMAEIEAALTTAPDPERVHALAVEAGRNMAHSFGWRPGSIGENRAVSCFEAAMSRLASPPRPSAERVAEIAEAAAWGATSHVAAVERITRAIETYAAEVGL